MILRKIHSRRAPARRHGWTARESFEAIAMKRADSGKVVASLTCHFDVSDFRVQRTMNEAPTGQNARADPSPDGNVGDVVKALRSSQARFSECGGIDIGFNNDPRLRESGGERFDN